MMTKTGQIIATKLAVLAIPSCRWFKNKSHCKIHISCLFLQSLYQVDMKNIGKCWKGFLWYSIAIKRYCACCHKEKLVISKPNLINWLWPGWWFGMVLNTHCNHRWNAWTIFRGNALVGFYVLLVDSLLWF
jgi:hypothetical protein